jgi:hypothetical protein
VRRNSHFNTRAPDTGVATSSAVRCEKPALSELSVRVRPLQPRVRVRTVSACA